jgi:hypothetical protein
MKKINLAENLLRFGVKNLDSKSVSKLNRLVEQSAEAGGKYVIVVAQTDAQWTNSNSNEDPKEYYSDVWNVGNKGAIKVNEALRWNKGNACKNGAPTVVPQTQLHYLEIGGQVIPNNDTTTMITDEAFLNNPVIASGNGIRLLTRLLRSREGGRPNVIFLSMSTQGTAKWDRIVIDLDPAGKYLALQGVDIMGWAAINPDRLSGEVKKNYDLNLKNNVAGHTGVGEKMRQEGRDGQIAKTIYAQMAGPTLGSKEDQVAVRAYEFAGFADFTNGLKIKAITTPQELAEYNSFLVEKIAKSFETNYITNCIMVLEKIYGVPQKLLETLNLKLTKSVERPAIQPDNWLSSVKQGGPAKPYTATSVTKTSGR